MGKVDIFRIVYENEKTTFYPWELINGTVQVKVKSDLVVREIRVVLYGEAWAKIFRSRPSSRHVYFNGVKVKLLGQAPGQFGKEPVLSQGEHSFPFQIQLPRGTLPTSFEGKHGYIRYWLMAFIERPRKSDIITKSVFTIMEHIDINLQPALLSPCQVDNSWGGCSFASGLTVTVQTDKGGYCPGETIGVSALISNQTWHAVREVKISLIQTVTYTVHGVGKMPRKSVSTYLATTERRGVRSHADLHLEMVPLFIPALSSPSTSCPCIKISYELKFQIRLSWTRAPRELTIPLVIGSVPGRPRPPPIFEEQLPEPSAPPLIPSAADFESQPPVAPPSHSEYVEPYPGVALPTYDESVGGGGS